MAIFKPKPVAPKPVAPKPVMGKPVMPGIKPLPPGSIGMPGGPGGKTVYNTGPTPDVAMRSVRPTPMPDRVPTPYMGPTPDVAMRSVRPTPMPDRVPTPYMGPAPMPTKSAPNTFAGALLGGGAAPSQPVMGNNIGRPAFKVSPATLQSGMKKGGKVSSASRRGDGIAQRGKTRI